MPATTRLKEETTAQALRVRCSKCFARPEQACFRANANEGEPHSSRIAAAASLSVGVQRTCAAE